MGQFALPVVVLQSSPVPVRDHCIGRLYMLWLFILLRLWAAVPCSCYAESADVESKLQLTLTF